jgi:hypothetical protein
VRRTSIFLVAVAAAALAGCGGGSKMYSAAPTRACLAEESRVTLSDEVDFVASNVLGGAFNVRFPTNQVTVMFGEDRDEAGRVVNVYKRVKGENIGLEDVLRVEGNVVMLWTSHPDEDDLDTIYDCLE